MYEQASAEEAPAEDAGEEKKDKKKGKDDTVEGEVVDENKK